MSGRELRAFAVTEHGEGTGGIIFAKHAVVARRIGADAYGDGQFGYVSCRRASWADEFAETGVVPASVMVEHGWHFECAECERRIDYDLPTSWENEIRDGEPLRGAHLRYARWKPEHVIGTQHSAVFCTKACKKRYDSYVAERKRRERKVVERFNQIVLRRFPDAEMVENDDRWLRPHVFITRRNERWSVEQVIVSFRFPGAKHGPASLRWDRPYTGRPEKPYYSCAGGDKATFEAWATTQLLTAGDSK